MENQSKSSNVFLEVVVIIFDSDRGHLIKGGNRRASSVSPEGNWKYSVQLEKVYDYNYVIL